MTGTCQSCNFEEVKVKEYEVFAMSHLGKTGAKTKNLCALCANSMAGVAYENPDMYPNSALYGVVCHVGNAILKAIEDANDFA